MNNLKKVISFSLWGNDLKYTKGAIKNAELSLQFYSDFECWFYIHDSVSTEIIEKLVSFSNTKIIYMKNLNLKICKPMCWRFLPISNEDVKLMICRDCDSRIMKREVLAVREWINSDYDLHIMRDHKLYHNYKIFGGMFGIKKYKNMPNWIIEINNLNQNNMTCNYDLVFLEKIISKIPKYKVLAHSEASKKFNNEITKKFPTKYDETYSFCGEYIDENENYIKEHREYLK